MTYALIAISMARLLAVTLLLVDILLFGFIIFILYYFGSKAYRYAEKKFMRRGNREDLPDVESAEEMLTTFDLKIRSAYQQERRESEKQAAKSRPKLPKYKHVKDREQVQADFAGNAVAIVEPPPKYVPNES